MGLGANRVRISDMAAQHTQSRAVASGGVLCYLTTPPKLLFLLTFHTAGAGQDSRIVAGLERCKA